MANDRLVDAAKLNAALTATADAIREKTGDTAPITFDYAADSGFADAVEAIQTGTEPVITSLTVTENGVYTAPEGTDGYSPVTVSVPGISLGMSFEDIGSNGFAQTLRFIGSDANHHFTIPNIRPNNYNGFLATHVKKVFFDENLVGFNVNDTFSSWSELESINSDIPGHAVFPPSFVEFKQYLIRNTNISSVDMQCTNGCTFGDSCIAGTQITELRIPPKATVGATDGISPFNGATKLKTVYFGENPVFVSAITFGRSTSPNTVIEDIYCPWSENDVPGAPWGAANAAIHYNYVPEA